MQRTQERFGLLDRGVVGGVLDHVQRPVVAGARGLGDGQPRREVVAPPDQGGGSGDPGEVRRRDRRRPELRHESAESGHHAWRAGTVDVVRLERLPLFTHPLAQAVQIERTVAPQTVVRVLGRLRQEVVQGEAELGRGLEPRQTERVHEHQPAEQVTLVGGEAGRDRATERIPHERWRRRAGALDQLTEPRDNALGVQFAAVGHRRRAVARQVGGDHPIGRHQVRDHLHPMRRVSRRTVQQDRRRAVTTLQHGRRDAGQLHASLRDGHPGQQPLPSGLAGGTPAAPLHATLPVHRLLCRHVVTPPLCSVRSRDRRYEGPRRVPSLGFTNFAAAATWSFLTTRRVRGGRARTRTRSPRFATTRRAWRRCSARAGRRCAR